jgi:hypothetical protein
MLTCGFFDGQPLRIVYRRRFVKIEQGWDGKERSVTPTPTHSQTPTHSTTHPPTHTHTHTGSSKASKIGPFPVSSCPSLP